MEVRNEVDNLDECLHDDQLNNGMFFCFSSYDVLLFALIFPMTCIVYCLLFHYSDILSTRLG